MDKHGEHFVETFVKELEEENVAIFAGAGLSVGAVYVDWKKRARKDLQLLSRYAVICKHDPCSVRR